MTFEAHLQNAMGSILDKKKGTIMTEREKITKKGIVQVYIWQGLSFGKEN
jgi:hypothetical protein